jgi:hypothetical protein
MSELRFATSRNGGKEEAAYGVLEKGRMDSLKVT